MTDTTAATLLTAKQWDAKFFKEYTQGNRFSRYFGSNENAMIQVKSNLTKQPGDAIHYALANRLTGAGKTGSSALEGFEEELVSRGHRLTVDQIRHAVRVSVMEEQKSAIPLREAAKMGLKVWNTEKLRDDIITALHSVRTGTGAGSVVAYGDATPTHLDAWLDDNLDRIVFGTGAAATTAPAGGATYDYSASLLAIATTETLSSALISKAKRKALTANPKITPIRVKDDEQWFVLFAHPYAMRDLKSESVFIAANREARNRGKDNPLFMDDDYIWDGVIIREIADIDISDLATAGTGSTQVAPAYLCGAQALGLGWAKTTETVTEEFDYKDKYGVACREIRGVEKLCFEKSTVDAGNWVQNGVVTLYTAAAAD